MIEGDRILLIMASVVTFVIYGQRQLRLKMHKDTSHNVAETLDVDTDIDF